MRISGSFACTASIVQQKGPCNGHSSMVRADVCSKLQSSVQSPMTIFVGCCAIPQQMLQMRQESEQIVRLGFASANCRDDIFIEYIPVGIHPCIQACIQFTAVCNSINGGQLVTRICFLICSETPSSKQLLQAVHYAAYDVGSCHVHAMYHLPSQPAFHWQGVLGGRLLHV